MMSGTSFNIEQLAHWLDLSVPFTTGMALVGALILLRLFWKPVLIIFLLSLIGPPIWNMIATGDYPTISELGTSLKRILIGLFLALMIRAWFSPTQEDRDYAAWKASQRD